MTFSALDSLILGPLFATAPMRAIFSDEARVAAFLKAEEALARAEADYVLAPPALADAITELSPANFDFAALAQGTALSGVPIIPFVKALQDALPEELRGHVHRGATTQDIFDTGLVLQMRDGFVLIEKTLAALIEALENLARRHARTPCAGRTYGQHAAPVTFGFKVAVWLSGILSAAGDMPALKQKVLIASLGGPVGTLSSLGENGPAIAEAYARYLGLGLRPIAWHVERSPIARTGAWLTLLLGALAKMAGDIIQLSATGIGEVAELHEQGRGGSSAMPHKRNPVSATVIVSAHEAAIGPLTTLFLSMRSAQERAPGEWHAEWHALPPLFALLSGALEQAKVLATGLIVDPDRMRFNLDATNGLLFAEAAAARLAPDLGRARAHALVEEASAIVLRTGQHLQTVLEDDPFARETERHEIGRAFDLEPHIEAAARWVGPVIEASQKVRANLVYPSETR
jgi:3-carboxy-cis,cis-muconate cycloisomerase